MRAGLRLLPAALGFLLCPTDPSSAVGRVVHVYDEQAGLSVAETCELAQDAQGFLWIGTVGGLARFDGAEMRAWAPQMLRHTVRILAAGPSGEVAVAGIGEPLQRIVPDGVEPIAGPTGAAILDWAHAAYAADGALWIAAADTLLRRAPDGSSWMRWNAADFDSHEIARVFAAGADSIFVATPRALWAVRPGVPPRMVAGIPRVWLVVLDPRGDPVALSWRPGRVWRLHPGAPKVLYESRNGGRGLAVRGTSIWANMDDAIVEIPAQGSPRIVAPTPELPTGRPILVDREGTLWIGGFRGLMALPEPETVAWTTNDGLPAPAHAHHLCRTPDSVWVISWSGTVRMDLAVEPRRIEPMGVYSGRIRADGFGRLWGADLDRGFIRWDARDSTRFAIPGVHGVYGTSLRADGSLWLATDEGLFLTPVGEGPPAPVRAEAPRDWPHGWSESWLGPVLEDRDGDVWIGHDEALWRCSAESLSAGAPVAWTREHLPGSEGVVEILELPDGTLWAATNNAGVQERGRSGWFPLRGNEALASLRVYGMAHSARGGVWVLAGGTLARVLRRPDLPDGWEVVERLTSWQGVPTQQASDIHEDPDGRLWLATLAGLVEVPPDARRMHPSPPQVVLVDAVVDGIPLASNRPVRLPGRRSVLELRFAGLSYRDRNRLRYQVRTSTGAVWRETREPHFRFVETAPGNYVAEVRASLDGAAWTDPPARLSFSVGRPWWQEPWAIGLGLVSAAFLLYAAYRVRIGVLLGLERQRMRIAMDLHDEVGSGLGSIGILAGLVGQESLDPARRREVAARIADTAGELSGALGDIVRMLRHGPDSAESFGQRLVARARRLVPGQRPRLHLVFPAHWPSLRLGPETQRQVQAIASEALHNAVRHADAANIELGLAVERDACRVWVRDDGRGLAAAGADEEAGNGLRNMRERARDIGADLAFLPTPGGGTTVVLRFDPHREDPLA